MTNEEREIISDLCEYLESLLADCIRLGIPQDVTADIRLVIARAREYIADNYDPTPYCSYGHMRKEDCDCGPLADND